MKTSELEGALLDYWVGKALGREMRICAGEAEILYQPGEVRNTNPIWSGFDPSTNWSKGGPIIDRERIVPVPFMAQGGNVVWYAFVEPEAYIVSCGRYYEVCWSNDAEEYATTPLIAAMRAYVASKFGDTVPDEVRHD